MKLRCSRCRSFLLFKKKHDTEDGMLCSSCYEALLRRKRHLLAMKKRQELKRQRKLENRRKAEQRLREELEGSLVKGKAGKKQRSKGSEKNAAKMPGAVPKAAMQEKAKPALHKADAAGIAARASAKKAGMFSKEEIESNERLLYVKADVKRIIVHEWVNAKKRVALNKNREIRRTHAGGFSAEKFQRFVDHKKKKAFEWIIDNLSRPGILRPPYDRVIVVSDDAELEEGISKFLSSL